MHPRTRAAHPRKSSIAVVAFMSSMNHGGFSLIFGSRDGDYCASLLSMTPAGMRALRSAPSHSTTPIIPFRQYPSHSSRPLDLRITYCHRPSLMAVAVWWSAYRLARLGSHLRSTDGSVVASSHHLSFCTGGIAPAIFLGDARNCGAVRRLHWFVVSRFARSW